MQTKTWIISLFLFLFASSIARAQNQGYNSDKTFDPTFLNGPGTVYRSGDGSPGPQYWQNRADYKINVSLNNKRHRISGSVRITYTNNSPDSLSTLWLHLEQNLYKKSSLGVATTPAHGRPYAPKNYYSGYQIHSVKISRGGPFHSAHYVISDTRMQIRLQHPLKPDGHHLRIKINYDFTVPKYGVDIMGRMKTKHGWIYQIGQWYPRMAVYDDVRGWNTLPFLGAGEFFLEYGNFDYTIEAPWNFIIEGSGKLLNPKQVLTRTEINRLKKARRTDKKVTVIKPKNVGNSGTRPVHHGRLKWHFKLNNARDVAWGASPAFAWDASGVKLPNGKNILAMALYPPQSAGHNRWGRSTEYVKASLKFYSKFWDFTYPYPNAVAVAGPVDGMEYPSLVFCGWKGKKDKLWATTTHEFGHTWFPMIVGSNERRYAWMDEGFNTFSNFYSTQHFNKGEYAHPFHVQQVIPYMTSKNTQPILTYADNLKPKNLGGAAYTKPAVGLHILRQDILGPKKFDYAFQQYIKRWAYKHPRPKDFFRTMNDASGEDLNWFWKEWFYKTWMLDQAIKNVRYINQDPSKGAYITLKNNNRMVMPVTVRLWQANDSTITKKLPVQIWQRGGTWTFKMHSTSRIDSV
ncbi:MAG TPA: M1 family metallopeptidase, partial [Balneolaceae bacterium]|nr:M1 family metallopeptidase [Balneolaceae bacterium]